MSRVQLPEDTFHFVLALIVLLGGGFLIWGDKGDSLPYAAVGMVLGFYFTRAGSQAGAGIADTAAQHAAANTAALTEGSKQQ